MLNHLRRPSLLRFLAQRIIAPLSIPMLALLILGVFVYQQLVASLILDRDSELGDLAALDLRIEIKEYGQELRSLASNRDLLSADPAIRQHALDQTIQGRQPLFLEMALLDDAGAISASTPVRRGPCLDMAISETDYKFAPSPVAASISNVLISPDDGESMIALSTALRGEHPPDATHLLGCVRIRNSDMIEVLASLTVFGSGYAYLVDRNGRAIFHPDTSEVGSDFSDRSYVEEVKAGIAGGTLWDSPEGDRWIVDYTPIPEAGWGVIVKESRDIVVAPSQFYGALLVGVGVLVTMGVSVLLWSGVKRVATPIQWLAEQTKQLSAGKEVAYTKECGIDEIDALGHSFERMSEEIASYRSSLRRYIGLITQSQEDERRRIARELHDDTLQRLISFARRIELMQDSTQDAAHQAQLSALREQVIDTVQGVRQISRDLRPPTLEELGLVNALHALAAPATGHEGEKPHVTLKVEGTPSSPLSSEQELMLFRIAQEALNNVRRHARARHADVRLHFENGTVQMDVTDDGQGFTIPPSFTELVQQGNLGLMGMQERVWAAEGKLAIESTPGLGTRVRVIVNTAPA